MSESTDKSIRVIQFPGTKDAYRMWAQKFLSVANRRGYKELLLGTESALDPSEDLSTITDDDLRKEKERLRKANKNGYSYIMLAIKETDVVSFNIIDQAKFADSVTGNVKKAWDGIKDK